MRRSPTSTASLSFFTIGIRDWPGSSRRKSCTRTQIIADHPLLGRPIEGRSEFRELILPVLNATYVFQYAYDGERLVMLRVYHGREQR